MRNSLFCLSVALETRNEASRNGGIVFVLIAESSSAPEVCYWPILLKKSAIVSTIEKYTLEIETSTLSRGFRVQISRSGAQKRRFQRSVCGQSGRTDFFNRIGRFLPVTRGSNRPKADISDVAVESSRRTRTSQKRNVIELLGGAKKGICMH